MDTIDKLKQIIHQQFDIELSAIDPDAPFASYDIDSLTLVELMFAIEDSFHVTVPDSAAGSIGTLRALAGLLDELVESQAVVH